MLRAIRGSLSSKSKGVDFPPLARGIGGAPPQGRRRLHLIVGDSNMSEVSTYLKIGTTALALDMIEDGFFDRDYSLQSPAQAIRDISHDPTLSEAIKLKDGCTMTALQMQLEYLEYATRYVDSISPDPATKDVLARWTDVLMKLESDPMDLSRGLDWVIKKAWIDKFMDRHRLSWRDPKGLAARPPVPRHPA